MMNGAKDSNITEDDLHLYADGLLQGDSTKHKTVEEYLSSHPQEVRKIEQYRRQRLFIRTLGENISDDDVPDRLKAVCTPWYYSKLNIPHNRRETVWVASIAGICGLAIGVLLAGQLNGGAAGFPWQSNQLVATENVAPNPGEASAYFSASRAVPDLSSQGFQYVGAQLVDAQDATKLSLKYIDASDTKLELTVEPHPTEIPRIIKVSREGTTTEISWSDGPLSYKLKSQMPERVAIDVVKALVANEATPLLVSIIRAPETDRSLDVGHSRNLSPEAPDNMIASPVSAASAANGLVSDSGM